eukprot:5700566-Alexandrium_andersonii.AAC.1
MRVPRRVSLYEYASEPDLDVQNWAEPGRSLRAGESGVSWVEVLTMFDATSSALIPGASCASA